MKVRQRIERKCLICNQKYYSPDQDERHQHGGEGRKSEHEAVEVASPSPTQIPNSIEKKIKNAEEVSEISTVDKLVPKKNKKIPVKKVDKRSREYRQSIGR